MLKSHLKNLILAFSYARRDLRAGVSGFYIFLACIVLSVAIICGIQSLSLGMKESLHRDGRYILGGDISLQTIYEPLRPEYIKFFREKLGPTTVVIETRAMARTMKEDVSSLVELKGVDPFYPLYGEIEVTDEQGKVLTTEHKILQELLVPPHANMNKWGVLVEKELLSRLNVKLGDWIMLGNQKFEIRGIVTKEPDRIGGKQFTIAPRVMISNYIFNATGLKTYGSQVHWEHKILMPQVKSFEDLHKAVKRIEDTFPKADWKIKTFLNASNRTEQMIERMTLFLTFTGLATLLIAGIGISNAVQAFIEGKINDIATLKSLGGKKILVFEVYMIEIFILATLGIVTGLAFGVGAAQLAGRLLTAKLALNDSVGFYWQPIFAAAALGYLITFCASLWPIGKAIKTSPSNLFRELIMPSDERPSFNIIMLILISAQLIALVAFTLTSDNLFMAYFLTGTVMTFGIFYLCSYLIKFFIKKIKLPAIPELRLALVNLYRPGNITSSVILSIGLGLTVLVAVALVQSNFIRLAGDDLTADAPSFFFLDVQPNQLENFKKEIGTTPTAHNLKIMPSFRGRIVAVNGKDAKEALVDKNESWVINSDRGFTYNDTLPANSEILEGKWWDNNYKGKPIISIASNVQKAFNIGVGDRLTVRILGKEIEAEVANVREVSWSSFTLNFATTFAPGALEDLPGSYIATVIVDKEQEETLQNKFVKLFPNVTIVKLRDVLTAAQTIIKAIAQAVSISAGVTLIAGILVLSGGVAAARKKHLYDAVIFKVLGATRKTILKTFILEYGILGTVTVIISAALGSIAAYGIQGFMMDMTWKFSWVALAGITSLCLIITLAAGFFGTWQALKQKPITYLRNE